MQDFPDPEEVLPLADAATGKAGPEADLVKDTLKATADLARAAGARLTFGLTGREAVTIELPLALAGELLANGGVLRLDLEARAALSRIIKHERAECDRLERERTAAALERRLP